MCVPTKDQVIQEVRQRLNEANHWVMQRPPLESDALWTRPVKTALCNACRAAWGACDDSISICSSGVGHVDLDQWQYDPNQAPANRFVTVEPGGQGRAADRTGQLYDVTCLRHEEPGPPQQHVLLAAEIAWSGHTQILATFANVLAVHAVVRVMVYHQARMPFETFAEHIREHQDTQAGDTYLLAAFGNQPQNPRIVYYRIDARHREAEDQCELAPIAEDFYLGWHVQPAQQG